MTRRPPQLSPVILTEDCVTKPVRHVSNISIVSNIFRFETFILRSRNQVSTYGQVVRLYSWTILAITSGSHFGTVHIVDGVFSKYPQTNTMILSLKTPMMHWSNPKCLYTSSDKLLGTWITRLFFVTCHALFFWVSQGCLSLIILHMV